MAMEVAAAAVAGVAPTSWMAGYLGRQIFIDWLSSAGIYLFVARVFCARVYAIHMFLLSVCVCVCVVCGGVGVV